MFIAFLLALLCCTDAVANGAASDVTTNEIVPVLQPIRDRQGTPALAAAIVTSKGLQSIGAIGIRKYRKSAVVTTNDLWHLGSDTKAMTATVVARLVERGLVRWDSSVSEIFPELSSSFHPDSTKVTFLHLLSHRAGVEANLNWGKLARSGTVPEQRLAAVKQGLAKKPLHVPGSNYLYSNLGYVIAGAMVERVTGKSWEELMKRELFEPLDMKSAGFGGVGTPGKLDQPWGHTKRNRPVDRNGPDVDNPPVLGPAGRVHCTLQDWSKFIADQLRGARGEAGLLKPESYAVLFKPPFGGEYALGWGVAERPWAGGRALTHNGCNTMMYANVWIAPERDFAILVCANLGLDAFPATDEAVAALIPIASAKPRSDR